MISRQTLNSTVALWKRLKRENPDLLNEDINAILVAASNESVAQALYSLGSSVEEHDGAITVQTPPRLSDEDLLSMFQGGV